MKSLLAKLGVILIGLIISGYAEVWGAECAWVLWEQTAYYRIEKDEPIERNFWEIIGAFPKYEQCLERKKVLFTNIKEQVKKSDPKADAVPFELVIEHFTETSFVHYKFICLPDTVDLRK